MRIATLPNASGFMSRKFTLSRGRNLFNSICLLQGVMMLVFGCIMANSARATMPA